MQSSYTMFRSMLPKLMVVPAASLSLFLVNIAGHQPPVDGRLAAGLQSCRWV